jgi:preprotein translocase subunit YajC
VVAGRGAVAGDTEGDHVQLAADSGGGGGSFSLIMIVLLIGALYFLMIRPQSKRRREAQQMQAGVAPGDEVQTVGGLYATVTAVDDDSVTLEAAPGVSMRYARGAIARVITRRSAGPDDATDGGSEKTIEQG